jgi:hypothetical protein
MFIALMTAAFPCALLLIAFPTSMLMEKCGVEHNFAIGCFLAFLISALLVGLFVRREKVNLTSSFFSEDLLSGQIEEITIEGIHVINEINDARGWYLLQTSDERLVLGLAHFNLPLRQQCKIYNLPKAGILVHAEFQGAAIPMGETVKLEDMREDVATKKAILVGSVIHARQYVPFWKALRAWINRIGVRLRKGRV